MKLGMEVDCKHIYICNNKNVTHQYTFFLLQIYSRCLQPDDSYFTWLKHVAALYLP